MGEAILVKAGGLGGNGGSDPEDQNIVDWQLKTELITESKEFIVPKAKNQQFSVRLFGGGAGGPATPNLSSFFPSIATKPNIFYLGGASGNMNYGQFNIKRGNTVNIIIGVGGVNGGAGATTSFGNYLSATGGSPVDFVNRNGGNGGVGTPPFIIANGYYGQYRLQSISNPILKFNGGVSTYGGGSGGIYIKNSLNVKIPGTNGGIYGGGGGTYDGDSVKTGGNGCGNGGNDTKDAENGTNTMATLEEFKGYAQTTGMTDGMGTNGNTKYGGGGGYGGNGGSARCYASAFIYQDLNTIICGSGGGYGSPGFWSSEFTQCNWNSDGGQYLVMMVSGFGGAYGGNASYVSQMSDKYGPGAGSGGYGNGNYSAGAHFRFHQYGNYANGNNGIAIITYYAPVYNNG